MDNFYDLIQELEKFRFLVYGIKVEMKNQPELEYYFKKDTRYPIYSVTKSIVSLAVGIAQQQGYLSIQDPLNQYLEEGYTKGMHPDQKKAFEKLSIERFLTMSIPDFPFRPQGDNWQDYISMLKMDYAKAPSFWYTNICAYLVGIAVENAVKRPLMEYMKEFIFDPMQMEIPEYQLDPQGHFYGASGMQMRVSELAKIGKLYLDQGVYKGKQLVTQEWIKEASSTKIENAEGGYGYFLWHYYKGYKMSGKWGQRSIILPQKQMVCTYLSKVESALALEKLDQMIGEFLFSYHVQREI